MPDTQEKSPNDDTTENNITEISGPPEEGAGNTIVIPIIKELLHYVQFHMRQTAKDLIAEVIKRFYIKRFYSLLEICC